MERKSSNLGSKKIDEIVRTDQLMLIMQERSRQEEPDILAINQHGTLFIFELKRWENKSENILQVLRYGQKFGRYDYDKLNHFFLSYSHNREKTQAITNKAHPKTSYKSYYILIFTI